MPYKTSATEPERIPHGTPPLEGRPLVSEENTRGKALDLTLTAQPHQSVVVKGGTLCGNGARGAIVACCLLSTRFPFVPFEQRSMHSRWWRRRSRLAMMVGRLLACPSVVLTFSVAMMMYDNYSTLCDALFLSLPTRHVEVLKIIAHTFCATRTVWCVFFAWTLVLALFTVTDRHKRHLSLHTSLAGWTM